MSVAVQTLVNQSLLRENQSPESGLHWFAVQTRPRHEKKVARELETKGIHSYLPVQSTPRRWSDRVQHIPLPLFPGYVFVRTRAAVQERVAVLQTNGITGYVGMRGQGIPIPDQQMQAIQTLMESGIPLDPYPFLQEGKRVRIRSGSLAGIEGVLVAKNEDLSLVISVEIIQRSLAVRISGFHVEPV